MLTNNNNNNKNNTIANTLGLTKTQARNRRRRNNVRRLNRLLNNVIPRALVPLTRRPIRNQKMIRRFRMPAAQTASVPKLFYTRRITGTSAVVAGCDLVYSIPNDLVSGTTSQVITMIPANPAYWTGTRIAQVAAGYQNYRPIQFDVIYVPQCAVTQQGNVLGGTLWNEVPTEQNLQQTLKTSNGGMLTQCYKTATSIVRMKSNLQYNLYRMGGAIDQESNPFMFIALAIACKQGQNNIVPGYFYIRYTYVLKNPIGSGITYSNSQLTQRSVKETYLLNASVFLCSPVSTANSLTIPIGSRLDVEYDNNNNNPRYLYYYNGTILDASTITNIWVLENQPNIASNAASLLIIKKPTNIYYDEKIKTVESDEQVEIPTKAGITFKLSNMDTYKTIINNSQSTISYPIPNIGTDVYKIIDLRQNFGILDIVTQQGIMMYLKDYLWTNLVDQFATRNKQLTDKIHIKEEIDKIKELDKEE